jgi:hypothetical protein
MSLASRGIVRLVALAGLVACGGTADPLPRQVIVGDFGGSNAMVHAGTQSATIDLGCSLIEISAPLLTDDQGNFLLTGQRSRLGGPPPMPGEGTTPMRVNGHASDAKGGTLELLIQTIPEEPGAPTGPSTLVVAVRSQQTNLLRCP